MVTISFDESGQFEQGDINSGSELMFIAGLLYCGSSEDTAQEKIRIRKFFDQICVDSINNNYPYGMHVSKSVHNSDVGKVKRAYIKALPEFIQHGIYNNKIIVGEKGEQRKGRYYIIEYLCTKEGMTGLKGNRVSSFVKDGSMSNLYVHMAEETLFRNIISNPLIPDINEVIVDIATRSSFNLGEDEQEEYNSTYELKQSKSEKGKKFVQITGLDMYRTAFEREMIRTERMTINVKKFKVRSISYNKAKCGDMEFLHLSDAICTYLGNYNRSEISGAELAVQKKIVDKCKISDSAIRTRTSPYKILYGDSDDYIYDQQARIEKLAGKGNTILFLYDTADLLYQKACDAIADDNMYRAAGFISDIEESAAPGCAFYKKQWAPLLKSRIYEEMTTSSLTTSIRKLYEATCVNNIQKEKLKDILEILIHSALNNKYPNHEDESVLYDIFASGADLFNHLGATELSEQCQAECRKYEGYADIFRQIKTRNALAVSFNDEQQYDRSIEISTKNIDFCNAVIKAGESVISTSAVNIELGRCMSQCGQSYAFMRKKQASDMLIGALHCLEPHTPDYYRTESYLLHYFIDMNMKAEFEVRFKDYMMLDYSEKKLGLKEKLDRLIELGGGDGEAILSLEYALYVYVKAFDTFYAGEHVEDELKYLQTRIADVLKDGKQGYPWILIYRHLASAAWKVNHDKSEQNRYYDTIKKISEKINESAGIVNEIKQNVIGEIEARINGSDYEYSDKLCFMYC